MRPTSILYSILIILSVTTSSLAGDLGIIKKTTTAIKSTINKVVKSIEHSPSKNISLKNSRKKLSIPSKKAPLPGTRRRVTKFEQGLVTAGERTEVNGKKIIQHNNKFKIRYVGDSGMTNCERMTIGLAPIGIDGKPINLHHLKQKEDAVIIELLDTTHKANSSTLHRYTRTSEIDRTKFAAWKKTIG